MIPSALPEIRLYERSGCHLCEDARTHLEALLATWSGAGRAVPRLVGRDIDSDPAWHDAFFETIPVVEIGGRRLALATSPARVRRFVEEALAYAGSEPVTTDSMQPPPPIAPAAGDSRSSAGRTTR